MNKKFVIVLVAFFCIAAAANSIAQSKLSYSLSAGTSSPTAPDNFDTNWKTGFNLGADINYAVHQRFTFSSSLQFNRFGIDLKNRDIVFFDANDIIPPPLADYGDANAVTFMLNVKNSLVDEQAVVPYVVGGIGLFRMWMENDFKSFDYQSNPLKNETSFLLNSGLGFKVPINEKLSFFAEGNFVTAFTGGNRTHYLPFKTGIIIRSPR